MAEAILFGIMQEVLMNVGSSAITEIAAAWGFKDQLEKLNNTINSLKNVMLDAEDKQADSRAIRDWLERLTTVVYAADDLFDEFNTVASRKQLMGGNNFTEEVKTFFSSNNQIIFAFHIFEKIKSIREKLDEIVENGRQFDFVTHSSKDRRVMNMPMRGQTVSYVDADRVIGRDEDKKAILDMLITFSSSDEEQLTVISIVGMGGMGKTALAQLIFNDPEVEACFQKRLWVCVSEVFDIKDITEKILKSATNNETPNLEMEQLQGRLRGILSGKKYLLVLDDVWNEDREKWLQLRDHLKVGSKGSIIMVTTRLKIVAEKMDAHPIRELQGLSEEKSWDLFERVAFKPGYKKSHLVKIGKEILKKCANVPLAIRTLGSLLYGEDEKKWLSFKDKSLAKISEDQIGIMNILKLSYHHLWSPLKNCFAYCALFPKDYEFQKEMLIDLWMAVGFIIPEVNENQSLDDAAEDYFQTLLRRGFFQDVKTNKWGAITSCKMHDLMHDLAQQVAGVRCKLAKSAETDFDDKILHLSFAHHLSSLPNGVLNLKLLRTFLWPEQKYDERATINESICQQLTRLSCLRVLDLHCLSLKSLPSSIGELIHLRFLNLSHNDIEKLPDSITQLHNLQTLNLYFCGRLRTLPENLRELAKLRSLDVNNCDNLSHLPSGLARLTSMNKLPTFIVSHNGGLTSMPKSSAKLSDLKELNNLRGDLFIKIHRDFENKMVEEAMEANLAKKQGLTGLKISFWSIVSNNDEDVLEGLKPPENIRKLSIIWYKGQKLPSWARRGDLCRTLRNLVEIKLHYGRCEQVPVLSQLRDLKHLEIRGMDRVEYMENNRKMQSLFFPSLVELHLEDMKNLKGWWKGVEAIKSTNDSESSSSSDSIGEGQRYDEDHQLTMQFCNLSILRIINCPNVKLKFLPDCPKVEVLTLIFERAATTTSTSDWRRANLNLKLKELTIDNGEEQQLSWLAFKTNLRSLELTGLPKMMSLPSGLQQLTNLRRLTLSKNEELRKIPEWISCLSSLEQLYLSQCPKLRYLPEALRNRTSLRLIINGCPGLT